MALRYSFLIVLFLLAACSRQPSITGEWALEGIRPLSQMAGSSFSISVSNPDTTRKILRSLFGEKLPAQKMESWEMEAQIDSILAYAQKAGLRLSSNREFGLDSYGLIVPQAVPGWNFGNRLLGEWDLDKDTLSLSIGDEEIAYTFRFIVLEKSSKTLKLRELYDSGINAESTIPGNEITFIRK